MKYHKKYGRKENIKTYFIDYATLCINKAQSGNGQKVVSPGKKNLGITKNYTDITLTNIVTDV